VALTLTFLLGPIATYFSNSFFCARCDATGSLPLWQQEWRGLTL